MPRNNYRSYRAMWNIDVIVETQDVSDVTRSALLAACRTDPYGAQGVKLTTIWPRLDRATRADVDRAIKTFDRWAL